MVVVRFAVLTVFLLLACRTGAVEPLLVYERTHSQVAHQDSTVRLVVHQDRTAELHFPFYSPNAGSYRTTLSAGEFEALLGLAEPIAGLTSTRLQSGIQRLRREGLVEVTDADRVRIVIDDPERGQADIVVPSPVIWARQLPEDEALGRVARVAEDLGRWLRERARETQP